MAIAGRAAIVPKDDFDAAITYKRLDMVLYNGSSYVAKKGTKGNLPTNTEFWMKSTESTKVDIATVKNAGIVKPDGVTITVSEDGTIAGTSPEFVGTMSEYETANAAGEIEEGTIVNITDDYEEGGCDCDKPFTGTKAEYDSANAAGQIKEGTIVNIIDDYDASAVQADLEEDSIGEKTNVEKIKQMQADIDYISMVSGIDLED